MLFGYIGFYYLITAPSERMPPPLIIAPKLIKPIQQLAKAVEEFVEPEMNVDESATQEVTSEQPAVAAQVQAPALPSGPTPSAPPIDWSIGVAPLPSIGSEGDSSTRSDGSTGGGRSNSPEEQQAQDPQQQSAERKPSVGNLIACIPQGGWVRLYRLKDRSASLAALREQAANGEEVWERIPGSFTASKIDGLPVDPTRFAGKGEPYRIELVVNDSVQQSMGNFLAGESEFRIDSSTDNHAPWCANQAKVHSKYSSAQWKGGGHSEGVAS